MSKRYIDTSHLNNNAESLLEFLRSAKWLTQDNGTKLYGTYVRLQDGTIIATAALEEEKLSDGSIVYNLILIPEKDKQ